MSAAAMKGRFGPVSAHLAIDPAARLEDLLNDTSSVLDAAVTAADQLAESVGIENASPQLHASYWSMLYNLRQGYALFNAAYDRAHADLVRIEREAGQ